MKVTKKQLLNITTGYLHTNMGDIYEFFNKVIADGIYTHHLPNALTAITPILKEKFPGMPFEGYHPHFENADDIIEVELTEKEKHAFWNSFNSTPSILFK